MTVSVDIETARHPDAVIASAADIHDMSGTSPWVLVVQGKTAARRSVRVGLVSGGRAEIISGLTAADRLVPATNAKITAGSRIRIHEAAPAVATP